MKNYNLYQQTNYYGNKMFAIAHVNAMPARFDKIILTGSEVDVNNKYVSETAYLICNTEKCSEYYPLIYQTAWNILYKGKPTNKQVAECRKLQYDNFMHSYYAPIDLVMKLKSIIAVNKQYRRLTPIN